jgi:hypothetical protein
MPRVWRSDAGKLGTHCAECHTDNNVTLTGPPLIRAFQAVHAGVSRHCRWLGKVKLSVTSVAN